jgi:hypothetical protein
VSRSLFTPPPVNPETGTTGAKESTGKWKRISSLSSFTLPGERDCRSHLLRTMMIPLPSRTA